MTTLSARQCVANALIQDGHDERATRAAVHGIADYLRHRIAELGAEGRNSDAAWYRRLLNEIVTS